MIAFLVTGTRPACPWFPGEMEQPPLGLFAYPCECLQQVLPGTFVAMVPPERTKDAKNKFQVKLSSCLGKEFSVLFVLLSSWLTVDML